MKRLVFLIALSLALTGMPAASAVATDRPIEGASTAPDRSGDPEGAEAEVPSLSLEDLLVPPAQAVCSCRDLCRNDAQCVLLYGPGSQCVPVGSCQCKECLAVM